MAKSPQWNVKGVDQAARIVARDAAAKAGLPIGAWIDRAVKRAARQPPGPAMPEPDEMAAPMPAAAPSLAVEHATDLDEAGRDAADIPEAAAPAIGPAPEHPAGAFPPAATSAATGRGVRIGLAFAIMALLTGGAVWVLAGRFMPPLVSAKPQAAAKTGREAASLAQTVAATSGEGAAAEPGSVPPANKMPRIEDFTMADKGDAVPPRATVAEIQRLLARLDFDPGPADGVLDKKTADAISSYQSMAGMTSDGKASPALLDDLREVAGYTRR